MAKSLRFIQCGDLHLGSPFHNLAAIDERWQRIVGKAPVRAFQKIVQMAIDKRVHAVLITGDVYTSADHNLTAQLDYVRGRRRFPFRPMSISSRRNRLNGCPSSSMAKKWRLFMARVMLRANSGKTWPGNSTVPLVTVFLSVCSILRSAAGNRRMRHVPWKI